ncbi:hypothetical protein [Streptomyces sp. NBC_00385]|uniref:hypothetical protein n=1 Tax=Streptomyces sp. NBC_00385 TaxID=2975733 RepID=UPI003FA39A08
MITTIAATADEAVAGVANWHTGDPDAIPAVGGAMDLAAGAREVLVMMTLFTRDGAGITVEELRELLAAALIR